MSNFDPSKLDVNLEKRTAILAVFFFGMKPNPGCDLAALKSLTDLLSEKLQDLFEGVVKIEDGPATEFYVKYDFGKWIPKTVWEMFDDSVLNSIPDAKTVGEALTKDLILEAVKDLYPTVQASFQKSAQNLQDMLLSKGV